MSFRARLTLAAAAAVALAIVAASAVVYFVVRDELRAPIDDRLRATAEEISHSPPDEIGRAFFHLQAELGGAPGYPQVVRSNGATIRPPGLREALPVDRRVISVAKGDEDMFLSDAHVSGTHVRVVTFPYAPGYAVQVARPLDEVDRTLHRIKTFLFLISAGGIAVAAGLGLAVSGAALAPVRRLTRATETVTATGDLSERIGEPGHDELGRLAGSFNTMMAALEEAERSQRQLVADASHELRTPLTSLRTNVEVLARATHYTAEERERVLADVAEQLEEMTLLVAELVELARGDEGQAEAEEVRLDLLAAEAVERARRRAPDVEFELALEESVVHGVPSRLERAVGNLLDNAVKWSPRGGSVEVSVRDGRLSVRDHGPGIAEEDLPFVFDRFYRAKEARGMPGSGLGLAIVRKVAEAHGGDVVAERPEGGGTEITLRLDGRREAGGADGLGS